MSSILQHLIRSLAIAERQILGSRRGRSIFLPTPDAASAWCHRCGATRTDGLESLHTDSHPIGCAKCIGVCLARDRTIRLGTYDAEWRNAILAVKHGGDRALAHELGVLLARQWHKALSSAPFTAGGAVVIPIPMPLARRVERGIDHASEIAAGVSKTLCYPLMRCLEHDAGPVQAQLTRADRQIRGQRIRWRPKWKSDCTSAATIFVVDDVLTTGFTASQACGAIRARLGSVKIVMLVVATTQISKKTI